MNIVAIYNNSMVFIYNSPNINNSIGFNSANLLSSDTAGFISVIPTDGIGIWTNQADISIILKGIYERRLLSALMAVDLQPRLEAVRSVDYTPIRNG